MVWFFAMIDPIKAVILGVIQGLTEFLPVSSSGHLVIAQRLLGLKEPPLLYDLLLHSATFLAVVIVLRSRVWSLLKAVGRLPRFLTSLFQKEQLAIGDDPEAWTVILIFATTAVTGGIGILFLDPFKEAFNSLPIVSGTLILTGILLFFSRKQVLTEGKSPSGATLRDALIIGAMQGAAILPGLSRSGTTIAAAIFLGFNRRFAGEYSFLISLPAIAGAFILESRHGFGPIESPPVSVAIGIVVALILGVISLKLLLGWIRSGRLTPFAYYCWAVGILAGVLAFRF